MEKRNLELYVRIMDLIYRMCWGFLIDELIQKIKILETQKLEERDNERLT